MQQDDTKNWRKIVLRTDGLRWVIDSNETNSSMLEILEIAKQIIEMYGYNK
jgi:hypothetical protein